MTKVQQSTSPWLLCRRRNPAAQVKIYCFPHSGGSPGEYIRWADDLPDAEVWGIQLPGRGSRTSDAAVTDVRQLVRALSESVDFQEPFVFFGHSLGALLAFETARRLEAEGREVPRRLLLSAMWAPHLRPPRPDVAYQDDAELLAFVDRKYGTVPEDVRNDAHLAGLMASAYRADFQMLDAYRYESADPLGIPLTLFGGRDDPVSGQLAGWREHTTYEPRMHLFPGGHFYLRERHQDFMAAVLRAALS
jgi:surfactin synthase thioesterase subunit